MCQIPCKTFLNFSLIWKGVAQWIFTEYTCKTSTCIKKQNITYSLDAPPPSPCSHYPLKGNYYPDVSLHRCFLNVAFSELSIHRIIQNVLFCVWLLSLSKMFVRFIHIACHWRHDTLLLVGVWSVSSLHGVLWICKILDLISPWLQWKGDRLALLYRCEDWG